MVNNYVNILTPKIHRYLFIQIDKDRLCFKGIIFNFGVLIRRYFNMKKDVMKNYIMGML